LFSPVSANVILDSFWDPLKLLSVFLLFWLFLLLLA